MRVLKTTSLTLVFLLACYSTSVAQQQSALTNKDVIDIVKMGLSEEIISAKIKVSSCKFDTSVEALKALKDAGVSDSIILLIIN